MPNIQLAPHNLRAPALKVDTAANLTDWLSASWDGGHAWMLAHAFDGVIWGRVVDGTVKTPFDDRRCPQLRWSTLLHLRIFEQEAGELRLWRSGDGRMCAVRVKEVDGDRFAARIDRDYQLLGGSGVEQGDGFDLRTSGTGDAQIVPRGASRLCVRHSYEVDPDTGLLRETEHRWLALRNDQGIALEAR